MHRDIMAGQNICNVLRSHVKKQERPDYLQPVDEYGNFPWKDKDGNKSTSTSHSKQQNPTRKRRTPEAEATKKKRSRKSQEKVDN